MRFLLSQQSVEFHGTWSAQKRPHRFYFTKNPTRLNICIVIHLIQLIGRLGQVVNFGPLRTQRSAIYKIRITFELGLGSGDVKLNSATLRTERRNECSYPLTFSPT
ncbi:hypothetical protein SUGI_0277700 [Cryptomeria japonica]|nr:hypothetical protein SUGI_0277700 [Cryptomeria japonica]